MKYLFVLIILMIGCASQESLYKDVVQINKVENYKQFLYENPNGEYTSKVKQALEKLEFENAKNTNTTIAYQEFIKNHQQSGFVNRAKSAIVNIEFENAKNTNTIVAYQEFIKNHLQIEFVNRAKFAIANIEFQKLKKINTITGYENFLNKHSNNELFHEEARNEIEKIYYNEAMENNSIKAFEEFLGRYPNGNMTFEAKESIKKIREESTVAVFIKSLTEKSQPGGSFGLASSSSSHIKKQFYRHLYYIVNENEIIINQSDKKYIREGASFVFVELVTTRINLSYKEALSSTIISFPPPMARAMGQISLIINRDNTNTVRLEVTGVPAGYINLENGGHVVTKAYDVGKGGIDLEKEKIIGKLVSVNGKIQIQDL